MPGHATPILLNFPDHFETDRLLIRAPRPGDGVVMREAIAESLEDLKPWMPFAQKLQSLDEIEANMRRGAARFLLREDLWLLLFNKSNGIMVGSSGLHRIDWSVPRFEIGYWVRSSLQGQGYITEAVNGITQFAFEQLGAERIEIRCDSHNERSAAVARRAGYTPEGHFRHDSWALDGTLRDTLIFAKVRSR